jgi:uncharacterized membrane protein
MAQTTIAPYTTQRTDAGGDRHPMEIWISHVLRGGVLLSATIILFGLALYLVRGPDAGEPQRLADVLGNGGQTTAISPGSIWTGVAHGRATGIIELGVLLLILTPMTRVAMTVLLFLVQRDTVYVAITLTVLVILMVGLVGIGS